MASFNQCFIHAFDSISIRETHAIQKKKSIRKTFPYCKAFKADFPRKPHIASYSPPLTFTFGSRFGTTKTLGAKPWVEPHPMKQAELMGGLIASHGPSSTPVFLGGQFVVRAMESIIFFWRTTVSCMLYVFMCLHFEKLFTWKGYFTWDPQILPTWPYYGYTPQKKNKKKTLPMFFKISFYDESIHKYGQRWLYIEHISPTATSQDWRSPDLKQRGWLGSQGICGWCSLILIYLDGMHEVLVKVLGKREFILYWVLLLLLSLLLLLLLLHSWELSAYVLRDVDLTR